MKKKECWEGIFCILGLFLIVPQLLDFILSIFISEEYLNILSRIITMVIIFLYLNFKYKNSDTFIDKIAGFSNTKLKSIIILFIIGIFVILTNDINISKEIPYIVGGIFIAPFIEEIMFRGYIQYLVTECYGDVDGILFTSLIFTFMHSQYYGNMAAIIGVFLCSLFLCYLKYKYKNIIYPSIIHMLNNFIALI